MAAAGALDFGSSEMNFFDYRDLKKNYMTATNCYYDE
jgi:hypothetical protein